MNGTTSNTTEQPTVLRGQVTKADAEKCGNFFNPGMCLLASALRRQFPTSYVEVYQKSFQVDDEFYFITPKLDQKIYSTYQLIKSDALHLFTPFDFAAEVLN